MTKARVVLSFLLVLTRTALGVIRRTVKRLTAPGTGPFLSSA